MTGEGRMGGRRTRRTLWPGRRRRRTATRTGGRAGWRRTGGIEKAREAGCTRGTGAAFR